MSETTLRWGVLGTAGIALNKMIPGMRKTPLGEVVALASRDGDRARDAAGRLGIPRAHGSYQALLDDPQVQAVYNPLPIHLHVEWSIRAMEAGKDVLCEKPIALDVASAERLLEARDRTGRQVLEAVMVRQHPQWLRAREIVRSGAIGPVSLIQTTMSFYNDDPDNIRNRPEVGGGALYDIGCYAVYLGRFLFDAEPRRGVCLIDRDPALGTDRLTGAMLDFGEGRQLSFACGTQLTRYQVVQIFGRTGRIEVPVSLNAPQGGETVLRWDPDGTNEAGRIRKETIPACDQYTLQVETAARIFLGQQVAEFGMEDALANTRAIDALYRSARTGAWETV